VKRIRYPEWHQFVEDTPCRMVKRDETPVGKRQVDEAMKHQRYRKREERTRPAANIKLPTQ
jgi:hypothetical protein